MSVTIPRTLSGLILWATLPIAHAVVVSNYSDPTNKRFTNDPSFIGANFDLSGVGRSGGRWGTAIGANYFLSANHFHPNTNSTITFVDGNSPTSASYSYTVGGGFRVGTTDLWVGYTIQEIDPTIARYGVTNQDADNLGDLGLGGSTLYMNGDTIPGPAGTVQDHIMGTNQAEGFYEEGSGSLLTPGSTVVGFNPPPGFENDMIFLFENLAGDDVTPTIHEALVESGVSGSPLFSASGNTLTIQGVSSLLFTDIPGNFIDPPTSPDPIELRRGSSYSYPGSYQSELNAAIALVPDPVPEASTVFLLLAASGIGLRRRRTAY